ncbi:MAG: hypothetical protein SEPTF4163_002359 [Sporothrix epigloea]
MQAKLSSDVAVLSDQCTKFSYVYSGLDKTAKKEASTIFQQGFERLLADAGSNDWFELIQNIMLEAALYPALSHDLQTRDETHPYP